MDDVDESACTPERRESDDDGDQLGAVAALYASERQDLGGLLAQSLALIGIGITYVAVAVGFLASDKVPAGAVFPVFLALPPWIVAAFHVLLLANVLTHVASVERLEARLVRAAGWTGDEGASLGSRAGDRVTNIATQPFILKTQTVISYGGVYVIIVSFTVYCILSAGDKPGPWPPVLFIGTGVYIGLALMSAAAWWYVLGTIGRKDSS